MDFLIPSRCSWQKLSCSCVPRTSVRPVSKSSATGQYIYPSLFNNSLDTIAPGCCLRSTKNLRIQRTRSMGVFWCYVIMLNDKEKWNLVQNTAFLIYSLCQGSFLCKPEVGLRSHVPVNLFSLQNGGSWTFLPTHSHWNFILAQSLSSYYRLLVEFKF